MSVPTERFTVYICKNRRQDTGLGVEVYFHRIRVLQSLFNAPVKTMSRNCKTFNVILLITIPTILHCSYME